ncbi:hypothetical protein [Spirosoma pollinicola]|uniref:hypothetical protein n=1 Tax=Spirosoma pollinicola TaxID=2057025 RepID=UPI0012FE0E24|nr:hypothetical protein [Spirosoma pollinicola]
MTPFCGQCQSKALVINQLQTDSVTALLNDINWHGKALASQESWRFSNQKQKIKPWFDIGFVVYSPYVTSSDGITHVTHILPSQFLSISHLPTTTGTFDLSDLIINQRLKIKVEYELIEGGDGITNRYVLSKSTDNWIKIIRYDPKTKLVIGAFNLELIGRSDEVAHFKNGVFKVRMTDEFK